MQTTSVFARRAARATSLLLAAGLVAGCGGSHGVLPGAPNVPGEPNSTSSASRTASAGAGAYRPDRHVISIKMRMRIPRRTHGHERPLHPSTISALTASVGIAINGAAAQFFDATPTSPGCSIGPSGTVCTFSLRAPVGTDAFTVTTYSGLDGGGTALNFGVATVPISRGKANQVAVTLGPVVSTNADSGVGSLRYAIETADSGDTIMFLLAKNTTITVLTPIQLANTMTLAGPGIASGVTISGGGTSQIFASNGSLTISGLTLSHGAALAGTPGGVIENLGSLTLANDLIGNSTSTASIVRHRAAHPYPNRMHPHCTATYAYGGAVLNAGFLSSTGTTYDGNTVTSDPGSCLYGYGGAIYNVAIGTIRSTGDTFENNSALEGGAVYNAGFGGSTFTNDTFTGNSGCNASTGCPTSGCTSTGCTSFAQGEGAAIFDQSTVGVSIVDSTFTNNVDGGATTGSQGQGGALVLTTGVPTITGSVFSGNIAGGGTGASCGAGEGGAIASGAALTLTNDTFSNNVASGDDSSMGGAIYAVQSVQGTNDTFTANKAIGYGSASSCSSSANGIGGAVFAGMSAQLSSSTFTNNLATGNDGGGGGAIVSPTVVASSDVFTGNAAVGTGAHGAAPTTFGGAIGAPTEANISGSTFTANQVLNQGAGASEAFGGAVFADGILSSTGNVFSGNSIATAAGLAGGGAVGTMGGTVASSDDTYKNNTATSPTAAIGGAAFITGALLSSGSLYSANSATSMTAYGGALGVSGSGEITSDVFTGNSANAQSGGAGIGGAFFNSGGAQFLDTTISNNAASTAGGGAVAIGPEEYQNSTVSGNAVTNANEGASGGGGIMGDNTVSMIDSTVADNSVRLAPGGSGGGGGIYDDDGVTLLECTVSGNALTGTGTTSGGGGIFAVDGLELYNSTVSGNTSSLPGGGFILVANQPVSLINSTMFQNSSSVKGGNIENLYTITITNSVIGGGTAPTGPDIDNGGTVTSDDYNIVQTPASGTAITTASHDKIGVDPKLLALANNGGPTFTNAEQATSPGVNYIPWAGNDCNTTGLTADQRGYTIGANGHCDVGAFDLDATPATIRHRAPPHASHRPAHLPAWVHPIHTHKLNLTLPKSLNL